MQHCVDTYLGSSLCDVMHLWDTSHEMYFKNFSKLCIVQTDVAEARVYGGLPMGRKNKDIYLFANLTALAADMGCQEKDLDLFVSVLM